LLHAFTDNCAAVSLSMYEVSPNLSGCLAWILTFLGSRFRCRTKFLSAF